MDLLARFAAAGSAARLQIQVLETRLRRTTTRERALICGLLITALVYAAISVLGWRDAARETYVDALTERASARLARAAAIRANANGVDGAAVEDMNTWGFEASNIAVAQVQLEQSLVESADRAGLTNVKISTDTTLEAIGPTVWLGAEIQADLRWSSVFDFLDDLVRWPEGYRITQFKYDVSTLPILALANPGVAPASGRVVIGIAAPVVLPPAEPTAAVRPAP